jgi:hypothetical protein
MRVLVLGTSGVEKRQYIHKITDISDSKSNVYDLDQQIKQEEHGGSRSGCTTFLDNPNTERQRAISNRYLSRILDELGSYSPKPPHRFLLIHSVYFRNQNYFSLVDHDLLREYQPDIIITLIDDFYDIARRINQKERELTTSSEVGFEDVLGWRNTEIMMGDLLSKQLLKYPIEHFVIAVKHDPEVLYRLLYERWRLRLYSAYRVRATRTHPERFKELNRYRDALNQEFTVFDPATIDERPILPEAEVEDTDYITKADSQGDALLKRQSTDFDLARPDELNTVPSNVKLEDFKRVQEIVDQDIQRRDYRLIDQSNAMVGYRPKWGGTSISQGVKNESEHAVRQGIPVYLMHPDEDGQIGGGPFSIRGNTVESMSGLIEQLKTEQSQRRENSNGPETWERSVYD